MKESEVSAAALGFYCLTVDRISPLKVMPYIRRTRHSRAAGSQQPPDSTVENEMYLSVKMKLVMSLMNKENKKKNQKHDNI